MSGYIGLYRSLQKHWLWKSEKPFDKRSAWIDILLLVNHKPGKIYFNNEIVPVDRGEHITSEVKLAERWGWSRTKVRNFLNLLEQDDMIENIKENNKRTRLRVLNYGDYQDLKNCKKTGGEQGKNNRKTGGEQGENTNKNDNNDNNVKNDNNINTSCSDSENQNPLAEVEEIEIKFDENSMPFKAAKYLRKLILENNPRQPVPDNTLEKLQDWALELDRLNRLGPPGGSKGYSWNEIGDIMIWCQQDEFWKNNILSASKFRKQITKLENKMKTDNSKQSGNSKREKQNQAIRNLYEKYRQEEEGE
ncbi:MAG: hypothetical protein ACLFPF_10890 [Halanaerobiales bacterium]